MYLPHNNSILSCSSGSTQQSLVYDSIDKKWDPYVFNVAKVQLQIVYNQFIHFTLLGYFLF